MPMTKTANIPKAKEMMIEDDFDAMIQSHDFPVTSSMASPVSEEASAASLASAEAGSSTVPGATVLQNSDEQEGSSATEEKDLSSALSKYKEQFLEDNKRGTGIRANVYCDQSLYDEVKELLFIVDTSGKVSLSAFVSSILRDHIRQHKELRNYALTLRFR